MPDTSDNLRIWNLANETDPTHTKPVSLGRKLTAIDSYYQIKRATEFFGPMGIGWGYESTAEIEFRTPQPLVIVRMKLWYMDPDEHTLIDDDDGRVHCPEIIASNKLVSEAGKVDEEAFKKATTDALTKSLSYLGFSADVFMGLFDDSRYVADMTRKFSSKRDTQAGSPIPESLKKIIDGLPAIKSVPDLEALHKSTFGRAKGNIPRHPDIASCSKEQIDFLALKFTMRKKELDPVEPEPELGDAATA